MFAQAETVTVTTAADGSATAYTSKVYTGIINSIIYTKTSFDDGSTITVTGETTATAIWAESNVNASTTRAPKRATCTTAGVASLYAAAGTAVNTDIVVVNERIKIVIASGGNAKVGAFTFIIV